MKILSLVITTVLLAGTLSLPAKAQHANAKGGFYEYEKGKLQKPKWGHYKGEIQVIDENPDVKYFNKPEPAAPIYQIDLRHPDARGGGGLNVQGGPGTATGGPDVIRLTPNRDGRLLAPAGYESNMNSLPAPNRNLAPGVTTGVHAKMDLPKSTKPAGFNSKSGKHQLLNQTQNNIKQTIPATYDPYAKNSASGASANKSTADVKGELKDSHRGSLLREAKKQN